MLGFQPISAMPISDVVYTELEITRDSGMKTWTLAKSETSWKLPPKKNSHGEPSTSWSRAKSESSWTF